MTERENPFINPDDEITDVERNPSMARLEGFVGAKIFIPAEEGVSEQKLIVFSVNKEKKVALVYEQGKPGEEGAPIREPIKMTLKELEHHETAGHITRAPRGEVIKKDASAPAFGNETAGKIEEE